MPLGGKRERRGKVVIPEEGLWLTGPVTAEQCQPACRKNALVLFSDADLYPLVRTSFEGLDMSSLPVAYFGDECGEHSHYRLWRTRRFGR